MNNFTSKKNEEEYFRNHYNDSTSKKEVNMNKIKKVLVANRGEIALRIIRACKELEIKSVSIFSEVDIEGVWVRKSDECYPLVGNPIEAYLNYERIIQLAKKANCDAIHPGYGFLSESSEFAEACEKEGILFIGPKAEHIALFGDKMASKEAMKSIGVPVLEGINTPILSVKEGEKISKEIGFPVIIKAAFGGGGKGMRIVREEDFIKGTIDTSYLDTKLEKFNLDAINHIKEEEKKMKDITQLLKNIKDKKVSVR